MLSTHFNSIGERDFVINHMIKSTDVSKDAENISESYNVRVSHKSSSEMDERKISKVFRRFGKIIKLILNDSKIFCTISYGSQKDLVKVIKTAEKGKLFGYELYNKTEDFISEKINSDSLTYPLNLEESIRNDCLTNNQQQTSCNNVTLILRSKQNQKHFSLERLCLMVSQIHSQLSVVEGIDKKTNTTFILHGSDIGLRQQRFLKI